MKRLMLTLAVFVMSLAAAQEGDYPRTITDGAGRELTLEQRPERVVALYNDNFAMLAALGVRPVGALINDDMRDPRYFADGAPIPSVESPEGGYDPETIASLRPDLIMAWSEEDVAVLGSIAPVYLPLGGYENLDEAHDYLRNVATVFALEEEAEAAIQAFENRLAAYKARAPRDISVMLAGPDGVANLNSLWIRTERSVDCQLLNEIAECAWEDPTGGTSWSYQTTSETLLALNPDVIYFWQEWQGTQAELLELLRQDPLWGELEAVQNGRVLTVPGYSNPIAGSTVSSTILLDTFAPLLYPDVFPEPLTDEQVQDILADTN